MGLADLKNKVDFTLAFAVVHEFPDAARFFREAANTSRPGSCFSLSQAVMLTMRTSQQS